MINGLRPVFLTLVSTFFLISCTHLDTDTKDEQLKNLNSSQSDKSQKSIDKVAGSSKADSSLEGLDIDPQSDNGVQQKLVEIGSGQFIAKNTLSSDGDNNSEGSLTLNFQETELHAFIKVILSDILQESYIIDPKVSGTVSIETSKPFHKDELFPLLEKILSSNDAAIVKSDGVYRILPKDKAAQGNIYPITEMPAAKSGFISKIISLKFISAEEMKVILEPYAVDKDSVKTDTQRNLLIVNGTQREIKNIQEIVSVFDVDWLQGMSFGLYPLDHVSPKVLTAELDAVLKGLQGNNEAPLSGLIRIVPNERLNSILLIGTTQHALYEAEKWLYRLDRPGEDYGKQLFIYHVQNAKAVELADILSNIFNASESKPKKTEAALAPGLTPVELSSDTPSPAEEAISDEGMPDSTITSKKLPTPTASNKKDGLSISVNEDIEIIADDVRNAVVVLASPRDYKMIEAAIRKLDIVPLQVLIEASIIEVTLNNDLRYGVEWFFKHGVSDTKDGEAILDLEDSGITNIVPGFSYTIIDSATDVRFALNALESKTNIDVVSTPSIMVLDNQQARINVGDQIPIPTRQSVSNLDPTAPTVNEIEFRDTGVSLIVKPRVNESGLVIMEVAQDVSDAQTTTSSGLDAPTIRQRQIESTVAIHSKETIVLGGLIRNSKNDIQDGVPYLSRLPVVGNLFGRTANSEKRTELLVLLTPTVIRDQQDADAITEEFKRRMRRLQPESMLDLPSN